MEEKKIMGSDKDVEENKVIAAIGYINILCFVPLLLKRESKFARFHGKQGLILFIIEVVAWFLWLIPVLGGIIMALMVLASLIGLLQALAGKWYKLPVIGQFTDKINI